MLAFGDACCREPSQVCEKGLCGLLDKQKMDFGDILGPGD
jgi:hypothetical protein